MSRFELLFMRHGQAEDHAEGGDSERALTPTGREQVSRVGAALPVLGLTFDTILCSPFRRAQETAQVVSENAGGPKCEIAREPLLVPSASPKATIQRLVSFVDAPGKAPILAVGHNPNITAVLGELVAGDQGIHFSVATGDLAHLWVEETRDGYRGVVLGFYPSGALGRLLGD